MQCEKVLSWLVFIKIYWDEKKDIDTGKHDKYDARILEE